MTLEQNKKFAKHILRFLKVDEIIFPICRTSKGNFGIRYGVNTEDYEMYLDAVPLPTKDILTDDNNIELKKMLEKYLFDQIVEVRRYEHPIVTTATTGIEFVSKGIQEGKIVIMPDPVTWELPKESQPDKPKRGRPKGSTNKPKE